MEHLYRCPLCSSENLLLQLRTKDFLTGGEEFALFRCEDCRFVFTQDHPSEKEIEKYYNSGDYISHDDSATGILNRLYHLSRNFMLKRKKKIVSNTTSLKRGNLLDVGSGTGYFGGTMKEAGWSVSCIEPNKKARDFGIKKFKLKMIRNDQVLSFPDNHFDCITLWHVLEHFHDFITHAEELKRLLKPTGIMIVALPNSDSYDSIYYKEYWAAYDVPRHLWHFNPASFKVFSERVGLHVKEVKQLPLDVFYISVLSERNRGSRISFLRGMLTGSIFSLMSIFNKSGSSSLIYILRKPPDQ